MKTGDKFGRLTAIQFLRWTEFKCGKRQQLWLWRCDCGKETKAFAPNVKRGHTKSCGCYSEESRSKVHTIHGGSKPGQIEHLYIVWCSMKQRCEDTNHKRFKDWVGRGIQVQWKNYEEFRSDMLPDYKPGLQIERRDNNGHYCKENCKWATAKEQALNRRSNRLIEFKGETLPLSVWAERASLKRSTVAYRLKIGWSVAAALTTPV